MKKSHIYRRIAILLTVTLILSLCNSPFLHAKALKESGTCGPGTSYTFSNGDLSVAVANYDVDGNPVGSSFKVTSADFAGNTDIKSLYVGPHITDISSSFSGCTALERVSFSAYNVLFSIGRFDGCTSLRSISIPGSVMEIPDDGFKGCSLLESVDFKILTEGTSLLTEIGDRAFLGCTALTSIVFPGPTSIRKIGRDAFKGCSSLNRIDMTKVRFFLDIYDESFYDLAPDALIYVSSDFDVSKLNTRVVNGTTKIVVGDGTPQPPVVVETQTPPQGTSTANPVPTVPPSVGPVPTASAIVAPTVPPMTSSPTPSPSASLKPSATPFYTTYPMPTFISDPRSTTVPAWTPRPTSLPPAVTEPAAPKAVKNYKVSSDKKHTITISWKKIKKAEGYQIWCSKTSNFKHSKIVYTKQKQYTIKNVNSGTNYYIRVRAFVMGNRRIIYGDWTKTKKVKVL